MFKKSLYLVISLFLFATIKPITTADANQAPIAQNQSVTTNEDTSKAITLAAADADGNPLTYAIVSTPLHGTLTGTPPNVTYKPASNYNGADSFTFKASDGVVDSNIATVSITIIAVNDPPVAKNQSVSTNRNTAKAITLTATDVDNDPLTYQVVAQPAHGTLSGTPPSITYTPAVNYTGSDSLTFKANDGMVDSNVATVSITVVNHAPVANNQTVSVNKNTAKAITLVATDTDKDPLTYQIVAQPGHGTLSGTPPSITYTPAANYTGSDSLTFKANDGMVDSNVATVSITVVNHAPVANGQNVSVNKNTAKAITLVATDTDKDPLIYQIVAQPSHGTLSGTPPSVSYMPAAGYSGSDSLTFKANDGMVDSNVATVSITVVNHAPVANNQNVSTNKNTAKAITLVATDADKDPLTYQIVAQPSHGTLSGTPPSVTYTPVAGYSGSDSFTFKANDGMVDSNAATVSITVVNHAPVANNQNVSTNRNAAKGITLVATDADNDSPTYLIVAQPSQGTLSGIPPSVTYTPTAGYVGSDNFTFKANDGKVDSNVATVSITVVNHAPVANNQSVTTNRNAAKGITLVATDADNDSLTYLIVVQPSHGTLSGTPPSVTYTPTAGYIGSDNFTFKANDGKVDSNVATVSITVVNHLPVAQNQNVTTNEDTAKAITLVAIDQDNDNLTYTIVAQPTHGTLSGTPPSLTYRPTPHYYGSDSFTFKANDGKVDSNVTTVSITINHINHPPVAQNQSVTISKNTAKAVAFVATDADNDAMKYQIVSQPVHGTLTGTPPSVTYTPAAGYAGSDSFTFKANDGKGDSNVATVSVTVANNAPVAQDQSVPTAVNKLKEIVLSATDPNGDVLTYQIVAQPGHGVLSGATPDLTYTPAANYIGSDSFTFKAYDGLAYSTVATVSIAVSSIITTVAGNGTVGFSGDGGPATQGQLFHPWGVAADASGNLYISDSDNMRIRKVDGSGIMTTFAGTGRGECWSEGPAAHTGIGYPEGMAADTSGDLYIADPACHRIRKVDKNGILTTVAGSVPACVSIPCFSDYNSGGYGGDGGPATASGAALNVPTGVALDTSGNLYIADSRNHRIRKVDTNGIITTAAGNGSIGYSGDGGPATQAQLYEPSGVALDASGNLYITDTDNNRIRKVDTHGIITTVAGNGIVGYGGDGGPATQANLGCPYDVAVDGLGNIYIADSCNNRIRRVDVNGIIITVAGNGSPGYGGDGGPAIEAEIDGAYKLTVDASGSLYIADAYNQRVRKVEGLFMSQDGTVTGKVTDSLTGLPLSDVHVTFTFTITNHLGTHLAKTGSDGTYTVSGLPPGGFTGIFVKSGYIEQTIEGTSLAGQTQTLNIELASTPPGEGIITTVAGTGEANFSGDGGIATRARLNSPTGVTADASGNLYIADTDNERIRKVDQNGIITTVAGIGTYGYSGDGGPATQAQLWGPSAAAIDPSGNLYIADQGTRIRKVDINGIITTVAGKGTWGYGGDGGPASAAQLNQPSGLALDRSGNLYIADSNNNRIRKVDMNGMITTLAGSGVAGFGGDGGPATSAILNKPSGIAVDLSGNLYIADQGNRRIRKVDTSAIITTVAGNGNWGYSGDGGPATQAAVGRLGDVAVDALGNLYIVDSYFNRIRKVDTNGIVTTVAGNGMGNYSGDGGPATQAALANPLDVTVDTLGNLYIADNYSNRIRKVDTNGVITTVAGGIECGDGGLATQAPLDRPSGIAVDPFGNYYIADKTNLRIRKVDTNGIITTVAGTGAAGFGGDGGPATQAKLSSPLGLARDVSGNLYFADGNRIRKVSTNGIIATVAGNGSYGYSGDGGPATQAQLYEPSGVGVDASGNLYIADTYNNRVRKVNTSGMITTVAGGAGGYGGDGGLATAANLYHPSGVIVDASGDLYISDTYNHRIRKVDANGIITTFAGYEWYGYSGDYGPAIEARLNYPLGMALDASGNLYISDEVNHRIRKVDTFGIISTIAGTGSYGYSGDGGPAIQAMLNYPEAIATDALGSIYIADTANGRVRKVGGLFVPTTAAITGKATDSRTGSVLSGVMVTIKDALNTSHITQTSSNGTYMVSGLTAGSLTATFVKSGYVQKTANGTSVAGQTVTLDIQLVPILPLNVIIISPQDGSVMNSSPVAVTGNVSNNANVTVNGIQASVTNGTFSGSIALSEGPNTLTATATDQYGQTASQTIHVTLVTKGSISGTVKDSSTGLPLPSATVSVTDFLKYAQTTSTDNSGKYTISAVASGAFGGSITKGGYTAYNFSGTMVPGQIATVNGTLNPILPIISDIAVGGITINSATITWTTDQPTNSLVNYGISTSYGSSCSDSALTTSHMIQLTNLTPATTYHFKVTSKNTYGFSSSSVDLTFKTSTPVITLEITSPSNGAVINGRDTLVKGTLINPMGNETGVVVNGLIANVYGNEFIANHVPLVEGSNTITVSASDTSGHTQSASVTVNAVITGEYIKITSNVESGLSPLEATLTIESSLDLTNAQLTNTSPGPVQYLSTSVSEYTVSIITEGIYYFTANVRDKNNNLYQDTIAITVLSRTETDSLLRAKWEDVRTRLANGDIEGSLVHFDESTRQDYRDVFNVLSPMLLTITQEMSDIQLIEYTGDAAIYDIRATRDGIEYSFQLLFTRDPSGIWRISSF